MKAADLFSVAQGAGLAAEIGGGVVEMLLQVLPRALLEAKEALGGWSYCLGGPRALWSNLCPREATRSTPPPLTRANVRPR